MKVILYTDGAARGNPGPAGAGAYLCDEQEEMLAEVAVYLGETTNNVAEYQALLHGLRKAIDLGADEITIAADSQLMVRQILGQYRVKHPGLIPLYREALALLKKFRKYSIKHIDREENYEADRLANQAVDRKGL